MHASLKGEGAAGFYTAKGMGCTSMPKRVSFIILKSIGKLKLEQNKTEKEH